MDLKLNILYLFFPFVFVQALVYQDGILTSGTLEAFVQHLVPTATYYPDVSPLFSFMIGLH